MQRKECHGHSLVDVMHHLHDNFDPPFSVQHDAINHIMPFWEQWIQLVYKVHPSQPSMIAVTNEEL